MFCDDHRKQPLVWLAFVVFTVAGAASSILSYISPSATSDSRVFVYLQDDAEHPVLDARIWSSPPSEVKKLDNNWELEFPAAEADGKHSAMIYAEVPHRFLNGQLHIQLPQKSPVRLVLTKHGSFLTGIVLNENGMPVDNASVIINDTSSHSTVTDRNGRFKSPVDASDGEQLRLIVEKVGYRTFVDDYLAGQTVQIVLHNTDKR